jgi:nucleoside 2-deoxyribosyltransferase
MADLEMSSGLERLGGPSALWRVGIYGELSEIGNSDKTSMAKCFYLATRKDDSERADTLSKALNAHGWERTFTWKNQNDGTLDGNAIIAAAEIEGVRKADVLIVLLPGGFGTHVEIGAALALGKPVILHAPDRTTLDKPYPCVFHYHPRVKLLVSETLEISTILAFMDDCTGQGMTS